MSLLSKYEGLSETPQMKLVFDLIGAIERATTAERLTKLHAVSQVFFHYPLTYATETELQLNRLERALVFSLMEEIDKKAEKERGARFRALKRRSDILFVIEKALLSRWRDERLVQSGFTPLQALRQLFSWRVRNTLFHLRFFAQKGELTPFML